MYRGETSVFSGNESFYFWSAFPTGWIENIAAAAGEYTFPIGLEKIPTKRRHYVKSHKSVT
jgi:hypothetical protein